MMSIIIADMVHAGRYSTTIRMNAAGRFVRDVQTI
jgi:hypothetical protein